jgi:hypothetical protein
MKSVLIFHRTDPGWIGWIEDGSLSGMRIRDLVAFWLGSGTSIPDHISETIFWGKIYKFFDADADLGIFLTVDPGWKSRIRDKHSGSTTLIIMSTKNPLHFLKVKTKEWLFFTVKQCIRRENHLVLAVYHSLYELRELVTYHTVRKMGISVLMLRTSNKVGPIGPQSG